jgi:hypothetical protein
MLGDAMSGEAWFTRAGLARCGEARHGKARSGFLIAAKCFRNIKTIFKYPLDIVLQTYYNSHRQGDT